MSEDVVGLDRRYGHRGPYGGVSKTGACCASVWCRGEGGAVVCDSHERMGEWVWVMGP